MMFGTMLRTVQFLIGRRTVRCYLMIRGEFVKEMASPKPDLRPDMSAVAKRLNSLV